MLGLNAVRLHGVQDDACPTLLLIKVMHMVVFRSGFVDP
jgi:hypothetical protein